MFGFAFSPFSLVGRAINKVLRENVEAMILVTPTDTTLVYFPTKNVHTTSITFTSHPKPITKSPGRKTSSCENQVPKVSSMESYGKSDKFGNRRNFKQYSQTPCPGNQVQLQVTNQPGTSGLAGVADNKFIQFVRL